jgi:hypothetical protein
MGRKNSFASPKQKTPLARVAAMAPAWQETIE